ncbi:MAG: LamG domain-containing protein [Lentisphaerota bacterium]
MRDLYANAVETQISMISQAGPPYEGNVALNQDNLNNVGLIQLYKTVLVRAGNVMDASGMISADANQQLLLAASRLDDLYMLLGNEAYADAQDPTIGFGSTMVVGDGAVLPLDYGAMASSIFCFDNQVPSLLEEELALLRGRGNPSLAPGMGVTPVYNRLYWNYTRGIKAGEVAYSVHYDMLGHTNVVIDAQTAAERFPQGHGDAWGYYLDALKSYYALLTHPTFDWGTPSISPLLMNDLTIDADYFDEKKFAEAGAALARTGAEIVQQTYRQAYDESQQALFAGYTDANTNRAWGVGEWGARVGVGAVCNWMIGNSLLPVPSAWLTNSASLALDGAGYGQFPGSVYFGGDFTIEIWIRPMSYGMTAEMDLLSFANSNNTEMVQIRLLAPSLSPTLDIVTGSEPFALFSTAQLATGQWSHVAAVMEGNLASLYVNGVMVTQVVTSLLPATVVRTNNYVGLGSQDIESFIGSLCEIRIWSAARSAADIAGAMHTRLNGGESGLTAYWPLNEGRGTMLLDRSYGGLSARAVGETRWTNSMPEVASNYAYDDPGILKIDRSSVEALAEMAGNLASVQSMVDNADRGLNPLGLARSAIPFDISPAGLDEGTTHFEQILERAEAALNNANRVFDSAKDASLLLRRQQQNAQCFQEAANSQEGDYKRRLIELYGYPYSEDIGIGRTYPTGYDGPDIYHYMYVDMSALGWSGTDVEPLYATSYEYVGTKDDSQLKPFGFNTNEPPGEVEEGVTNVIAFSYAANGLPCKPSIWTGSRRAEGRLQKSYGEFLKQLLSYRKALDEYTAKTEYLNEMVDWYVQTFYPYKYADYISSNALQTMKEAKNAYEALIKFRKVMLKFRKGIKKDVTDVEMGAVPGEEIVGVAAGGDIFAPLRDAIMAIGKTREEVMTAKDVALDTISIVSKLAVESAEYGTEIEKLFHEFDLTTIEQETEIGELVRGQKTALDAAQIAMQSLMQSYQDMVSIEQEGERILSGRERTRKEAVNRISSMRYSDLAFRLFRDDALSRYHSTFDLAAMYAYLAAKAYDYETGLLPAESSADPGSRFLASVVRARTIGKISGGQPQLGGSVGDPGLADILARMKANWSVLDGRLGFNNPDRLSSRFSLRTELFRILPGAAGDANWRQALEACKVDNLFDMPEFRSHCIPFASEGGLRAQEPGFVIPFSTSVNFGYNFFGHEVVGSDNTFLSTHFATKIRSVGIWFSNYSANVTFPAGLQNTPQVYLVPAGMDTLRSPTDLTGGTLRSWLVQDQAIPIPEPIGADELDQTDWIPLYDSLPETLAALRRYPLMRAYHDSGSWDSSQLNYSSRLVGRSVWNSQWYLIIPAGALNSDRRLALEVFINGVNGDGNGIKDIRLFFETYSYSGN